MLSVKQGGIKYHFLSLWYDSTWDWTQVSRAIGEHSIAINCTLIFRKTNVFGCFRSVMALFELVKYKFSN